VYQFPGCTIHCPSTDQLADYLQFINGSEFNAADYSLAQCAPWSDFIYWLEFCLVSCVFPLPRRPVERIFSYSGLIRACMSDSLLKTLMLIKCNAGIWCPYDSETMGYFLTMMLVRCKTTLRACLSQKKLNCWSLIAFCIYIHTIINIQNQIVK
jgi:hypothetical protein